MTIAVKGDAEELIQLNPEGIEWISVKDTSEFLKLPKADAYFILDDEALLKPVPEVTPLFVNSVITTIKEGTISSAIRINGWNGFLKRDKWEFAGEAGEKEMKVFEFLKITPVKVKDEAGLIAARVLSMIINEAFFALEEEVSTQTEIDIAMKLGTNYPKGPFEWGLMIGMEKICALLTKLSLSDNRYQPSALLAEKCSQ